MKPDKFLNEMLKVNHDWKKGGKGWQGGWQVCFKIIFGVCGAGEKLINVSPNGSNYIFLLKKTTLYCLV